MHLKYISPISYAYLTHEGLDGIEITFKKLVDWSSQYKHTGNIIRVYHDNFINSPREEMKMDVGIQIFEPINFENEFFLSDIHPNQCITNSFEIDTTEFSSTWKKMYEWMKSKNYKPSLSPPFEIILNDYNNHPRKKCIVEMYIPIDEPSMDRNNF